MTTPTGLRSDSTRTPNASRAGALHSHIHSHLQRQNSRPKAASMTSGSRGSRPGFEVTRGLLVAGLMDAAFAEKTRAA